MDRVMKPCECIFVSVLFIIGVAAAVLAGFAIVQLLLDPGFSTPDISLSAFNVSLSGLDVALSAHNPSKSYDLSYDNVTMSVFLLLPPAGHDDGAAAVSRAPLSPFFQGVEHDILGYVDPTTAVLARLPVDAEAVRAIAAAASVAGGNCSGGPMATFRVAFSSRLTFASREKRRMSASCDDVAVAFKNVTGAVDGSAVGLPKRCRVDLLRY